jgi:hypothetical protein
MRPRRDTEKRCLWCGAVYSECDRIFGIPKCPRCFRGEKFIYIDKQGNPKPDYEPHTTNGDWIPTFEDIGCEFATDFVGSQSRCVYCPFPKCVDDKEITQAERDYLKQWRIMIQVYDLADGGLKPIVISHKTGVSKYLIGEWLKRRDFFEPFIRQPVMAGGIK